MEYFSVKSILLAILFLNLNGYFLPANACVNDEDCLMKAIFASYNKDVRPVLNATTAVNINVTLVLNSLGVINEKSEWMSIVGFFRMRWIDQFLSWDPSAYGGREYLLVQADQIWLPDVVLSNSASTFYETTYRKDFKVKVSSNGQVQWSFGGIFKTSCTMDLTDYPFDSQYCYIEMENWMYNLQDVNLHLSYSNPVDTHQYSPNSVWTLGKPQVEKSIKYGNFASLKFTLEWHRKTLYYYANIMFPIILMLLVALGVFWLPAECGEKISLAITILLAFSVFQIIIMENTPVNSDVVPSISRFVMIVMALASTSLITSMLVVYITGKSSNTRAPRLLRMICFEYLARPLCLTDSVPVAADKESSDNGSSSSVESRNRKTSNIQLISATGLGHMNPAFDSMQNISEKPSKNNNVCSSDASFQTKNSELCNINQSVAKIREIFEDKEASDFICDEWKCIALIIDRIIFWTVLVVMLVSLLIIWT